MISLLFSALCIALVVLVMIDCRTCGRD